MYSSLNISANIEELVTVLEIAITGSTVPNTLSYNKIIGNKTE